MNDLNKQIEQLKVDMKLLWGTRREFLFAFITFGIAFAIAYFLAYAEYNRMAPLQNNKADAQDRLEKNENLKLSWQKAISSPDYVNSSDLVNQVLPSSKPVLANIYAFNQLVATHPISLTKFEFAPGDLATSGAIVAKPTNNIRKSNSVTGTFILINLSAIGQFDQMMKFLHDMENMIPIGNIYTAQISKSKVGSSSVRLTYLSYYFDQQTNVTSGLTLPQLTATDKENIASLSAYAKLIEKGDVTSGALAGGGKTNLFESIQGQPGSRDQELLELLQGQIINSESEVGTESAGENQQTEPQSEPVLGL